jgi:hypothetical protein
MTHDLGVRLRLVGRRRHGDNCRHRRNRHRVASVPDVIGQSVDDATATLAAAGLTLRIVRKDGEDLAATADFVVNRVNVASKRRMALRS